MKNIILFSYSIIFLLACTFDYGESDASERETPDLVMENVEYVRVRSSDPIARFTAERAERYEKQGVMKLTNFSFEQFGEKGEEINAFGRAGHASIDIESGDIFMSNGVRIEVESEDIIMETSQLDWKDEPRILSSGTNEEVNIYQENGTHFTGIGLRAETRSRTYEFSGVVSGIYIDKDEEEEERREERRAERDERRLEQELAEEARAAEEEEFDYELK
ncbi:MAG: LPS export ABC transporter periplasmic protein LptC [Treponema sp.]|nr:LPS export ABC transporter periplasmic protein LptC [Treponema sp.]